MFVKKVKNINRQRVDTLDELTEKTCYYISRDHLISEIAEHLTKWKKDLVNEKGQYILFLASWESTSGHSMLMYAAIYNGMFPNPDINMVVDYFLEFVHHGNIGWLEERIYQATVSLGYFKSLAECQRAIKESYNLNIPDEFTSLDLYPVDGARKTRLFQTVGN